MKGSVDVLTKLFYLFSDTSLYNKAYMKNIISLSNFTHSQNSLNFLKKLLLVYQIRKAVHVINHSLNFQSPNDFFVKYLTNQQPKSKP